MSNPGATTDEQLENSSFLTETLGDADNALRAFYKKLKVEGELKGIIGPRDVNILWERHILNSISVVPYIRIATSDERNRRVADVGSGGGFPGLVVAACLPDRDITLIEPMERRCEWLNECIQEMKLDNVHVIRSRSEDVIHEMNVHHEPLPFSVVTCRAVAPMRKLVPWTLPLLKSHGSLFAIKGRSAQLELDKATDQLRKFHGIRARVEIAPTIEGIESTHIIAVEKR